MPDSKIAGDGLHNLEQLSKKHAKRFEQSMHGNSTKSKLIVE